jgi:hypothetical protein
VTRRALPHRSLQERGMANPDIIELTRKNKNFRKVLSTNKHSQWCS